MVTLASRLQITQDEDLFYVTMTNESNDQVCSACYMRDKAQRLVIIQLDTPLEYRGNGYATALLERLQSQEGTSAIRVISTSAALGFYQKLGYTQVSPYIFQHQ